MPTLIGIPLPALSEKEIKNRILSLLHTKKGVKIFTPNASMLEAASRDLSLGRLLQSAELLVPDGSGVVLASRLVGEPLPCRLTGIDLAQWLLGVAESRDLSVFFLGGKPGVAKVAADQMQSKHPRLRIAGICHGYETNQEAVIGIIREACPDLLFVCLGFPKQEQWMADHLTALPSVRMALGLGGALDVWSGRIKRAPKPMQDLGLEWLWRTAREPRRLRTALSLPRFLGNAVRMHRWRS